MVRSEIDKRFAADAGLICSMTEVWVVNNKWTDSGSGAIAVEVEADGEAGKMMCRGECGSASS